VILFRQRYEEDLRLIGSLQAWLAFGAFGLLLVLAPLVLPGYLVYNLTLFFIYSLVAVSLAILVGFTGQVSLGHAGFLAAGAYTAGYLTSVGWPFFPALGAALLVCGVLGLIIGIPALRLEGPYLAIATLGFGLAIQQILNNWALVGASTGLLIDRPALFGYTFWDDTPYYYLVLAIAALAVWMSFNLERSHFGRAMKAVRDADLAAQMSGVNLAYTKTLAFVLSAALTGVAGALFGPLIGYITPESFNLLLSIKFLLMVVVGGLGFIPGAIIGAAFITGIEVWLAGLRAWSQFVFGLVVIALMMLEPLGIYGRWLKVQRWWKTWPL
jgi:branched-chain amino acid transport system permease protein